MGDHVQIYHFHDWCAEQLRTYHVDMIQSDQPYWDCQVESVIQGVDKGYIPRAQYGALLIDEGHGFESDWLKLVVQREIAAQLRIAGIPHVWLEKKQNKLAYDPAEDRITVLTIHSSKGLEFPRVIIAGIGQLGDDEEEQAPNARLLYVGMTRAQDCLIVTTSRENRYTRELYH